MCAFDDTSPPPSAQTVSREPPGAYPLTHSLALAVPVSWHASPSVRLALGTLPEAPCARRPHALSDVELHLLAGELEDAETLVTSLATNTEYRLAHSCLENEAELELAEQLHLMQVRAAEGQLKEAREVR